MLKRYFKNLYGLRFISALTVALSHFETIKSYRGLHFIKNRFIEHSAQIAVTFFFVLSGFLIMWRFLEQTEYDTRKINIKSFYCNRIFRTWPLYFLIVVLSFVICCINGSILNESGVLKKFGLYFLFMPNTADILFRSDVYLGPTWSLAVEEFFYFIFPIFIICINPKNLIRSIIVLAIIFLVLSSLFNPIVFEILFPNHNRLWNYLLVFFERYRIYSFLLGALVSLLIYENKIKKYFSNYAIKVSLKLSFLIILFLFLFGLTFSFLTHQIYSLFFAWLILLIIASDQSFFLIENKAMITGGKVSFGIYLIHMFVVMRLVNQGFTLLNFNNKLLSLFTSWFILITMTCIISFLIYKYFENPIRMLGKRTQKKGKKEIVNS